VLYKAHTLRVHREVKSDGKRHILLGETTGNTVTLLIIWSYVDVSLWAYSLIAELN